MSDCITNEKKEAYRFLMYYSFLHIRSIEGMANPSSIIINPFRIVKIVKYINEAGAVANWMHNLALFSSLGFRGFKENEFWQSSQHLKKKYPETFAYLKGIYESRLREIQEERKMANK